MLKPLPGGEQFIKHGTYKYLDDGKLFVGVPDAVRIGGERAIYIKDDREMVVNRKELTNGEADRFNRAIPEDHKDWFTRGRGFRER